ncbi:MAG: ATP-dependent helicase, partial [Allobranchiibius sp.]
DQTSARAYARVLADFGAEKPVVVLSDDAGSSGRIEEFAQGTQRWMVAVRMVSEGVDVPRMCVGVYATSAATPLYFAQAVGRFVRARRRGETASIFLPSVPTVLEHAARLEEARDHALDRPMFKDEDGLWDEEDGLLAAANASEPVQQDQGSFEALESDAEFDHVLFDAQQFGLGSAPGSADEQDFLGLPGLLEPDQVSHLLRQHQSRQVDAQPVVPAAAHRALAAQRKELNSLVAAFARKSGDPHAKVHSDLRRSCGGPALDRASSVEVGARIDTVRRWFVGRR